MSLTTVGNRDAGITPLGKASVLTVRTRVLLGLGTAICLMSLLGIVYLYGFHKSQNEAVLSAFSDPLSQYQDGPLSPDDIVELTHSVCTLRSNIGSISSFLQPVASSISEGGWCGNYVRVFIVLANANGYPAQKLHLRSWGSSHTMAEIYYEGKWRAVDPFFNIVYRLPDGELATFDDIHSSPELSRTGPVVVGEVARPRLGEIYEGYLPIFHGLFGNALEMEWGLDESSLYHTGILILNYPLSLFYEGPRRPVIPNWIDRPEFLGIYALTGVFLVTAGGMGFWFYRQRARRIRLEREPYVEGENC